MEQATPALWLACDCGSEEIDVKQHGKLVITITAVLAVLAVGAGAFAYSGLYNIGADDPHTKPVYAFMQTLRMRSIARQAQSLKVPDLTDPELIRQGAGNYAAMCTGCHLAPGMAPTELSKGLYPLPPNLSTADIGDPSHHFWVIKHGVKASGMPAWGKSMQDQYIWGMVAFLQKMPKMDDAQFDALVASSGGHSHGGGESMPHDDGNADHHDGAMEGMHMEGMGTDEAKPHAHPAGTPAHDDSAPAASPATKSSKPVEDGHDHKH